MTNAEKFVDVFFIEYVWTAYIRKETHTLVKIELLKEDHLREFSQLVQELLEEWVKSRT